MKIGLAVCGVVFRVSSFMFIEAVLVDLCIVESYILLTVASFFLCDTNCKSINNSY